MAVSTCKPVGAFCEAQPREDSRQSRRAGKWARLITRDLIEDDEMELSEHEHKGCKILVCRPEGVVDNAVLVKIGTAVAQRFVGAEVACFLIDLRGLELTYDVVGFGEYWSKFVDAGVKRVIVSPIIDSSYSYRRIKQARSIAQESGLAYTGKPTPLLEMGLDFVAENAAEAGRIS